MRPESHRYRSNAGVAQCGHRPRAERARPARSRPPATTAENQGR